MSSYQSIIASSPVATILVCSTVSIPQQALKKALKKGELHEPFAIDLRRDRQIFNAGAQGDDRHRSA
jgi:hypothetical protein